MKTQNKLAIDKVETKIANGLETQNESEKRILNGPGKSVESEKKILNWLTEHVENETGILSGLGRQAEKPERYPREDRRRLSPKKVFELLDA